jgi:hypothetical protein
MDALLVVGIFALCLFSGCASIATAKRFNDLDLTVEKTTPVVHLNVRVSGLYLLPSIPLTTGETEGGKLFAIMKNTATLDECVNYLTKRAKAEGCSKVTDMVSSRRSRWLDPRGFFILWWKSAAVSANGVK